MIFPDGSIFTGNYKDGMMNGIGKFTFTNGSVFVGQYSNDYKNGKGSYIDKDGETIQGIWENGILKYRITLHFHLSSRK